MCYNRGSVLTCLKIPPCKLFCRKRKGHGFYSRPVSINKCKLWYFLLRQLFSFDRSFLRSFSNRAKQQRRRKTLFDFLQKWKQPPKQNSFRLFLMTAERVAPQTIERTSSKLWIEFMIGKPTVGSDKFWPPGRFAFYFQPQLQPWTKKRSSLAFQKFSATLVQFIVAERDPKSTKKKSFFIWSFWPPIDLGFLALFRSLC